MAVRSLRGEKKASSGALPAQPRAQPAPRRPIARVEVIQGPAAGAAIYLFSDRPLVIGRSRTCDLRIDDPSVSRQHVRLSPALPPSGPVGAGSGAAGEEVAILVEDLESRNGTFLGETRVATAVISRPERLGVGEATIRLLPLGPVARDAAATGAAARRGRLRAGGPVRRIPAAPPGPPQIPGYEIQGTIGSGGFGIVYRAIQLDLRRPVALKTIRRDVATTEVEVLRFVREARVGAALSHPSIVAIYDAGVHEGTCYCVMELVDGEPLALRVKREGRLPEAEALRIAIGVAEGLKHAHERGIVHRDVKPANILLAAADGQTKLADFGLAKALAEAGRSGLTQPGEGLGTIAFTAPEQLLNAVHAGREADVYALGATLFRMIAGVAPFLSGPPSAVMARVLEEPAPPLESLVPGVSPKTAALVARCLEKEPKDRFPSAAELLVALEAAAAGLRGAGDRA